MTLKPSIDFWVKELSPAFKTEGTDLTPLPGLSPIRKAGEQPFTFKLKPTEKNLRDRNWRGYLNAKAKALAMMPTLTGTTTVGHKGRKGDDDFEYLQDPLLWTDDLTSGHRLHLGILIRVIRQARTEIDRKTILFSWTQRNALDTVAFALTSGQGHSTMKSLSSISYFSQ